MVQTRHLAPLAPLRAVQPRHLAPSQAVGIAADERRREILAAASKLFRAKGLHATGMREIAASLGMTAGSLYYYFPSKQDLLAYCQEATLDQLLLLAAEIEASPAEPAAKLTRLLEGHVSVLNEATPGSLAHLEINEVPAALQTPLRARRRQYERVFSRLIEQGVASGAFRPVDPPLAALALLGAVNWTVQWFDPAGRKSAREVGREFADLLVAGLVASPESPRPTVSAAGDPR